MEYKKIFSKKIYYKIIKFFKQHPNSVETAEGISGWLEIKNLKKIQKALEKLSELGILTKHEAVGINGYGLTQDEDINEEIDKYLDL